jgi:YVTN family beta-propeller protein
MMSRAALPIFLALLVPSCVPKNEITEPQNTPAGQFSAEVRPVFSRSCGGSDCHGGGPRGFAGGLDLTSYDAIFRGSKYGTVVVPGNSFMSHLVQSVNSSDTNLSPISSVQMPASRDPLAAQDVQTIVRWIRDGARNDDGTLPFPEPRPLGKLFFTSQSVDLVGVIDLSTNLIMRYVTAGNSLPMSQPPKAPHNVQIDDDGRYYYVTLISGNTLKKYDAVTNQLLGEVGVGTSPAHVVITHSGATAYVTNFDATVGRVYKVNTATMTVANVISMPGVFMLKTHGARFSHDEKYLYVTANSSDNVTVIQTSNDSIVTQIRVVNDGRVVSADYLPYQVAVRGDDSLIYATLNGNSAALGGQGFVSVIRRSGDSFTLVDTIRVGLRPLQCEVTKDQRYLYVCNQGSGSVSVIDAQTNRLVTTIPDVGKQPHGIDISDDSRTVYVTCENQFGSDPPHHPVVGSKTPAFVVYIDVATQTMFRRIEVGGFAAGISVFPGRGN